MSSNHLYDHPEGKEYSNPEGLRHRLIYHADDTLFPLEERFYFLVH